MFNRLEQWERMYTKLLVWQEDALESGELDLYRRLVDYMYQYTDIDNRIIKDHNRLSTKGLSTSDKVFVDYMINLRTYGDLVVKERGLIGYEDRL